MVRTSSKWDKFGVLTKISSWRSKSFAPKTTGSLTKVFWISEPNLVILAWSGDELWCGQAWGWHIRTHMNTNTQTDAGNDNTWRPKLTWGKKCMCLLLLLLLSLSLSSSLSSSSSSQLLILLCNLCMYHATNIIFCINSSPPSAANMRQWIVSALVQIMACCLFGAKPLSKPMLGYCQLDLKEQTSVKF